MTSFDDHPVHPDDAQILHKLARSSDLSRPREQLHFLFFDTEESTRAALAHAAEHGWEEYGEVHHVTGVPDEAQPMEHPWTATVRRTDMATNAETLPGIRRFFTDLCADFNGFYDGWEANTDGQTDDSITMEELGDDELQFLVKLRELAKKIDIADDLEAAERTFQEQRSAWHAARPKKRFDAGAIIHALGVTCGDILANQLDLRWVRLTDQHGTDFALISEHGDASGITVFPINAVSTRWADPAKPGLDAYVTEVLEWARESGEN